MSAIDPAMDIAKYLNANTAGWFSELKMRSDVQVTGNNLFVHDMPDRPDFAVAITRYEGAAPIELFSNPLSVRNPRIQIQVRHPRSEQTLDRADDILRYLCQVKDQVIYGAKYQRIKPVGEPFEIGPDSSNRQRAIVNFSVSYYDRPDNP